MKDTFIMKDGRKVSVDFSNIKSCLAIKKKDWKEINAQLKEYILSLKKKDWKEIGAQFKGYINHNIKSEGYTELVKITEAALSGDKEKGQKYVKQFCDKHPLNDLVFPFLKLLEGNKNPKKLGHGDIAEHEKEKNAKNKS